MYVFICSECKKYFECDGNCSSEEDNNPECWCDKCYKTIIYGSIPSSCKTKKISYKKYHSLKVIKEL